MSNTPLVLNGHRQGKGLGKPELVDHLNPIMYLGFKSLAADAGKVAIEYDVSREQSARFAIRSDALHFSA